jgi:hypothetical protein
LGVKSRLRFLLHFLSLICDSWRCCSGAGLSVTLIQRWDKANTAEATEIDKIDNILLVSEYAKRLERMTKKLNVKLLTLELTPIGHPNGSLE